MLKICESNWKDMTGYDFTSISEAAAYILKGTRFNFNHWDEVFFVCGEKDEEGALGVVFQGELYMPVNLSRFRE